MTMLDSSGSSWVVQGFMFNRPFLCLIFEAVGIKHVCLQGFGHGSHRRLPGTRRALSDPPTQSNSPTPPAC